MRGSDSLRFGLGVGQVAGATTALLSFHENGPALPFFAAVVASSTLMGVSVMLFRRGVWKWIGVALAVAAIAAVVAMALRRSHSAGVIERTLTEVVPEGSTDVHYEESASTPFSKTTSVVFVSSMQWNAYGAWVRHALGGEWNEQGASTRTLVFVRRMSGDEYTLTIERRDNDTRASIAGRAE